MIFFIWVKRLFESYFFYQIKSTSNKFYINLAIYVILVKFCIQKQYVINIIIAVVKLYNIDKFKLIIFSDFRAKIIIC